MELRPAIEFMRQGKHEVMVGDGDQGLLLLFGPAFGGVLLTAGAVTVATAVVIAEFMAAVVTLVAQTSEGWSVAVEQVSADFEAVTVYAVLLGVFREGLLQDLLQGEVIDGCTPRILAF